MRFPDFSQVIDFIRLRQQMGIVEILLLPSVKFEREVLSQRQVEVVDGGDRKLLEDLNAGSLDVKAENLSVQNGLLTLGGRKIAAYIRDQKQGIDWGSKSSGYRYHLTDCSTLQSMRAQGRERRYLATRRRDGWFPVNDLTWGNAGASGAVRLELCKNCQHELRKQRKWFQPFSLEAYFAKFDSDVPRKIRRIETVKEIQTYRPEQADLSREYRKAMKFRCQLCPVDCSEDPGLLHLHHRDGDPSNNAHENLAVLCIECHAEQPLHGHLKRTAAYREQVARVRQLRARQGIAEFRQGA